MDTLVNRQSFGPNISMPGDSDRERAMSHSSAILDSAGAQILDMIRPTVPLLEKLTPTARLKHPKALEPSPASTLGDSATEGSDPATPQDGRVQGESRSLLDHRCCNAGSISLLELVDCPLITVSTCIMRTSV